MVRIAAKATKGKGKRWARGQSSTSNPESKKHRARVSQLLPGGSDIKLNVSGGNKLTLTKDVLEKFDAVQQQKQRQLILANNEANLSSGGVEEWLQKTSNNTEAGKDDAFSINEDAFSIGNVSAASIWSNCTNVTFDRFLNDFDPKSRMHKAMLTVLAAVRDAIELEKGAETETEYFAALMLTLNCVESEEKLTAAMALIKMVLKRVSHSVLKAKFSETSATLMNVLKNRVQTTNTNGYLIKSIIGALHILLENQEASIWQLGSTQKLFDTLLMFVLHPKPRIRKAASFAIISMVCSSECAGALVARRLTAEFCIDKLKTHLKTTADEHLNIVLYIFSLLSDTMSFFPSVESTKRVSELIFTHMSLGNVLIVTSGLHTFYSFFMRRPDISLLSAELNARSLNALYQYQPNMNDDQPLNAWCSAFKEGLLSLHNLDASLSYEHTSIFLKTAIGCLQSDSAHVHSSFCNSIKTVVRTILDDKDQVLDELLVKIFIELESALKYQYSHAWIYIIPMLAELFIKRDAVMQTIGNIMQRLAIIYENKDEEVSLAIDHYFARAVKFYGPGYILTNCPVTWKTTQVNGSAMEVGEGELRGEFTNAWLLPILRDNVHCDSHLAIFVNHFLPIVDELNKKIASGEKLAARLKRLATEKMDTDQFEQSYSAHESCLAVVKELKRCVHALWALLPAFCRQPTDMTEVFGKFAKRLGETLYDRELCIYALSALRNLLKCTDPTVAAQVAVYAKNYLPILFNIYTNENENSRIEESLRFAVFILIKLFIPFLLANEATANMFKQFYRSIRDCLNKPNCSEFRKNSLLDMLRAFITAPGGFNLTDIEEIYNEMACPLIQAKNSPAEQKKGLRLIEEIMMGKSAGCEQFVKQHLQEYIDYLFNLTDREDAQIASASASALYLRALRRIVERFLTNESSIPSEFDWDYFTNRMMCIVWDVLNLKSSKARKSAEDSLRNLAELHERLGQHEAKQAKPRIISLIIEGLRSFEMTVSEKTARLAALIFLYEQRYHHPLVSKDVECYIADAVLCQIYKISPNDPPPCRPVINLCLEFIRHFFRYTTPDMLYSYLEQITCGITELPQEHRVKYRMRIRVLLIKLIRKYSYETIAGMIPDEYKKVLKNIRKIEDRKKKKRMDAESEEDELDKESDTKSRRSRKSRKSKFNGSSDEEVDIEKFMHNDDQSEGEEDVMGKSKGKLDIMSRLSSKTVKSYIREEVEGDPLDLLSAEANRNVLSKIPKKFAKAPEGEDTNKEGQIGKLPVAQDGRLNLTELFDQLERGEKRHRGEEPASELDSDESEPEEQMSSKSGPTYRPGGKGIHRPLAMSGVSSDARSVASSRRSAKSGKSRKESYQIVRGDAYRSKTAAGDMTRRGMPDPYAYIPLNPMAMNKRKALKYKGEFKAIVKGARKGAAAGNKLHNKRARSK